MVLIVECPVLLPPVFLPIDFLCIGKCDAGEERKLCGGCLQFRIVGGVKFLQTVHIVGPGGAGLHGSDV